MDKSAERGGRAGASFGIRMFLAVFVMAFLMNQFKLPVNKAFISTLIIVFFPKALFGVSAWLAKSAWSVLGVLISSVWGAVTYTISGLGRIVKRLLTKRKTR